MIIQSWHRHEPSSIGEVRDAGHKEDALRFKSIFCSGKIPAMWTTTLRAIANSAAGDAEGGRRVRASRSLCGIWWASSSMACPCYQFLRQVALRQIRLLQVLQPWEVAVQRASQRAQSAGAHLYQVRYPTVLF